MSAVESGGDQHLEMTSEQLTRMLKLGLSEPRRPVDTLIDRLCEPGGWDRIRAAVDEAFGEPLGYVEEQIVNGGASLESLRELRERSLKLGKTAPGEEVRVSAMAVYFLCVAAALVQYREPISGRSGQELAAVFGDLEEVSPPSWREVFRQSVVLAQQISADAFRG